MARTVEDAVRILDVIAGHDPADPVTAPAGERSADRYLDALDPDGLEGARLGVLRQLIDDTADPAVVQRFDRALRDLENAGATVVDPVRVEMPEGDRWCRRFKWDLNAYLESRGPDAPVGSLEEVLASEAYHPTIESRLEEFQAMQDPPSADEGCLESEETSSRLRERVRATLADDDLDALVYPTWDNPPRLIGDLNTPHGNNSPVLSPPTGFPAVTVPMGFVGEGLPVGLQFLGDAWSEPALIAVAHGYERTTRHRRPPPATPELQR